VHDQLGVTAENQLTLDYAFRIPVKKSFLQLGLSGGFLHHKTRFSEILPNDNDPVKPAQDATAFLPRVGAGIYFYSKKFYFGASAPNLLAGRYFGSGSSVAGQLASKQAMHGFGMIGAILPMGENVSFRPSAVVKYATNAPIQADANITFFFAKVFGVGAGYRTDDALVFMLEYHSLRKFRAGYAYDLTLSPLKSSNSGSHEIMIGMDLGWGKSNFITPRYF
jgi:type IX secretion system PorP/SprF family membrane protein